MGSRGEEFRARGKAVEYPELSTPYLADYFLEVGPTRSSGMGLLPLDWQELQAWSIMTCTELSYWEAQALIEASGHYLAALNQSEKPDCPPFWQATPLPPADVALKVKGVFKALIAQREKQNGVRSHRGA